MYSGTAVTQELTRVAQRFIIEGAFYDNAVKVRSIAGSIIQVASNDTCCHMRSDLKSLTWAEFTNKERRLIDAIEPHNLVHDSAACRKTITGVFFPMKRLNVGSFKVEELKVVIIAHSSNMQQWQVFE